MKELLPSLLSKSSLLCLRRIKTKYLFTFKQRMEAGEEELHRGEAVVAGGAQRPPPEQGEAQTQRHHVTVLA